MQYTEASHTPYIDKVLFTDRVKGGLLWAHTHSMVDICYKC